MVGIANTIVFGIAYLGENLETKNDDISGSRGFYDAFEDVLRPQQHIRKGCECMI